MPVKTILFLVAFAAVCGGAIYTPLIAVVGYVLHYQIGPEGQWWAEPVAGWGIRYSFVLGAAAVASTLIHFRKLRLGQRVMVTQEWLLGLFLGLVVFSYVLNPTDESLFAGEDIPAVKFAKTTIFALVLTHVVTTARDLRVLFWAFTAGAAFLGWQAYGATAAMFNSESRLNKLGGADFGEANGLALFLAGCLPLIAAQFVRSGWRGKLLCIAVGVFATHAIVLTRSRAAVMGLIAGAVVALVVSQQKHRKLVAIGVVLAALGAYALADEVFWKRASTITATEEERDASAQSRIEIWKGGVAMFQDHPWGIGSGNFRGTIGHYVPQLRGADAHSTYVLCFSELGLPGILLYMILIVNAWRMLIRIRKECAELPGPEGESLAWMTLAASASLAMYLVVGLTGSKLYTESAWWFFVLPVCLWRCGELQDGPGQVSRWIEGYAFDRQDRGAGEGREKGGTCVMPLPEHKILAG